MNVALYGPTNQRWAMTERGADAVTRSGSGLDPHISVVNALMQAPRVAKARSMALDRVQALVAAATEGRDFGVLGEPGVNVLRLNMALDQAAK